MQSFKTQLSENIGLISRHWLGARRRLERKKSPVRAAVRTVQTALITFLDGCRRC